MKKKRTIKKTIINILASAPVLWVIFKINNLYFKIAKREKYEIRETGSYIFLAHVGLINHKELFDLVENAVDFVKTFLFGTYKEYSITDLKRKMMIMLFSGMLNKNVFYGIYTNEANPKLVGMIHTNTYSLSKKEAEMGCFIGEKYWSKGYASKAYSMIEKFLINKKGIKSFFLIIGTYNTYSIKVAERFGYVKTNLDEVKLLFEFRKNIPANKNILQ